MTRIALWSVTLALMAGAAAPAFAQTCNTSGTWTNGFGYTWNIKEDAAGNLTGTVYSGIDASTATLLSGSRSGASVTMSGSGGQSGGLTLAGTLTDCDTISTTSPSAFTMSRTSQTYCGNGVIEPSEQCDDGNFVNGDICTVLCTSSACGNHVLEAGEICDDGNMTNGDGCSTSCQPNVCGNSIMESGEECDDDNLTNGDGCSADCRINVCGNGILEPGEQCDNSGTDLSTCSPLCQFLGCNVTGTWLSFNTVWYLSEDAGGVITGTVGTAGGPASGMQLVNGVRTGLSMTTTTPVATTSTMVSCDQISISAPFAIQVLRTTTGTYCGDGVLEAPEQCDDGNFVNGDSCTALCTPAACGNSVVEAGELCDDNNATNGDGCSATCQPNVCGNGIVESGEECDDHNLVNGDGCSASRCQLNVCGNGVIEPGEQCDDNDSDAGDGCSGLCQFEGCNMTGQWAFNGPSGSIADMVEDASGSITGRYYSIGATSDTPFLGARTGTSVVLAGFAGTVTDCNTVQLTSVPVTFVRLSGSRCGDGTKDAGEDCDDGNRLEADGCTADCQLPGCGNGSPDPLEECDDGNTVDNDGCRNDCSANVCGDGTQWIGVEQCDAGAANAELPDALCRTDCKLRRCGDGIIDTASAEQCDDGNIAIADGCDTHCLVETIVSDPVSGGGTVTTDPGNAGATPAAPVQVAVTSPNAGTVTLIATSPVPTSQPGYQLVGKQVNIIAPDATPAAPLRFVFEIDAGEIPAGQDQTTLTMFRNGVAVAECPGSTVALASGPCVTARELLPGGDVRLTVLTAHASTWTFGIRLPQELSGSKLSLKAGTDPIKRKLTVQSKEVTLDLGGGNGTADDPVLYGATLRVRTAAGCAGACDTTYVLPKEHWVYLGIAGAGTGYKYKDSMLTAGPIKSGTMKPSKLAKFAGKGAMLGHNLDADPSPVSVTLSIGAKSYCITFGGTPKFVSGKSFVAKNAPAAPCP